MRQEYNGEPIIIKPRVHAIDNIMAPFPSSNTLLVLVVSLALCLKCQAFVATTKGSAAQQQHQRQRTNCFSLHATTGGSSELFKGGLLCDDDSKDRAAELASRKIKSVSDLGWKGAEAKRRSSIRPKLWPFGGSSELAIQDKANYSPENPNCPDPWLGLEEFYALVNDDTAAADLIFVSLAGGRAFVERDVAEAVLERWWSTDGSTARGRKQFDRSAFEQTVKAGQKDFIIAWSLFAGATGTAISGIVFPTNPLQLALVDLLDYIF